MSDKILWIGRHGKAPQKPEGGSEDWLDTDNSDTYSNLYALGQAMAEDAGRMPHKRRIFLIRSLKDRTEETGKVIYSGRLGMREPVDKDDLEANFDFSGIDIIQDPRFMYRVPNYNMGIYKERGGQECLDFWLANPESEEHNGVPIGPFYLVKSTARAGVKDALEMLASGKKDEGLVATHGSVIEPAMVALIESTGAKVERIKEFQMEDFAKVKLDVHRREGELYLPDGEVYPVDLNRL